MKRAANLLLLTITTLLVAGSFVATASAADEKIKGRYRLYMYDQQAAPVEGDVTQLADGSYMVENVGGRKGISMRIEASRVRRVEAIVEAKPDPSAGKDTSLGGPKRPGRRRAIADTEIEEVLAGIKIEVNPETLGVKTDDLMAPLPKNEDSVREMHRLANSDKEWVTDHFVMVYTGPDKLARDLGARLEGVWRWNVKFINILKLPAKRPPYKLEVYFFHKHQDFLSYGNVLGSPLPMGVLGFYRPDINRSHFFDMETWPPVIQRIEQAGRMRGAEGKRERNTIDRWIDFQNIGVVQHEAGHHIHFNIGLFPRNGLERDSSIPIWLVEGTTMLFEFPPSKAGAGIGTINHDRLNQVRQILSGRRWSTEEWKRFMIDNGTWQGGPSYPPAWAMVNYLWHEHREAYGKYLRAVFGREPDFRMSMAERQTEFEQFFGKVDDKWIERFYKYLDGLQLNKFLLPPEMFGF